MAITTTGSNADGYDTAANLDTYHSNRGNTAWAEIASTADKEAYIRNATQYVDAKFGHLFVGEIVSPSQALAWPRAGAYDKWGRPINGIPRLVKEAVAELALAASSENLVPVEDRGGRITEQTVKVGPITKSTKYDDGATPGREYRLAEMLLGPLLRSSGSTRKLVRS